MEDKDFNIPLDYEYLKRVPDGYSSHPVMCRMRGLGNDSPTADIIQVQGLLHKEKGKLYLIHSDKRFNGSKPDTMSVANEYSWQFNFDSIHCPSYSTHFNSTTFLSKVKDPFGIIEKEPVKTHLEPQRGITKRELSALQEGIIHGPIFCNLKGGGIDSEIQKIVKGCVKKLGDTIYFLHDDTDFMGAQPIEGCDPRNYSWSFSFRQNNHLSNDFFDDTTFWWADGEIKGSKSPLTDSDGAKSKNMDHYECGMDRVSILYQSMSKKDLNIFEEKVKESNDRHFKEEYPLSANEAFSFSSKECPSIRIATPTFSIKNPQIQNTIIVSSSQEPIIVKTKSESKKRNIIVVPNNNK